MRAAYVAGLAGFLERLMRSRRYDVVLSYPVQDAPSVAATLIAERLGIPFLSPKAIGFQAATCLFDDERTMRPCFRFRLAYRARGGRPVGHSRKLMACGARGSGKLPVEAGWARLHGHCERGDVRATRRPADAFAIEAHPRAARPESLRYPYPMQRLWFEWRRWIMARRDRHHPLFRPLAELGPTPFVYFPLHYEPEASLLVSAPEHTDQIAVIEASARALPSGWQLAVKEHRPMLGRRPAGYYERLSRIPGVVLVTPFEDGLVTMRAAQATITITGTAGFEAVLLGGRWYSPAHRLSR